MSDALKIGIAGLGTVGSALVRILQERKEKLAITCGRPITITAVSARDRTRDRGIDMTTTAWFDDPVELAAKADIDVFVELMGGAGDPADAAVRAALSRGLHVVTANKALLARHGVELAKMAEEKGALLNFEAAVAGGIPVIKALRESLTGNTVSRVYGIMNGTCNYILTKMQREGLSFAECLKEAQRLGYAEADPAFDIEGNDTAHKLAILTTLAFGSQIAPDDIYLEGITNISIEDIRAAEDLERIRLLFDDIETQRELIGLLGSAEEGEGVRIFIGSENKLFSLSGSSLVVSPYRDSESRVVGVLGVIGPTRLNYARIVPMVDYTAKLVDRLIR